MSPLVRSAPRRFAGTVLAGALTTSALVLLPAAAASAATPAPPGDPTGIIYTAPFRNSAVRMEDDEGSDYVPRDGSLWVAQDYRRLFEVNADTGDLRRTVNAADFAAVPPVGGVGPLAGELRSFSDIEALAYDEAADVLYVFSGENTVGVDKPAVFRMTRQGGSLKLLDYQLLPDPSDFTAAAWNPDDGKIYVAYKDKMRTYDFATNSPGPEFSIGLTQVYGIDFSDDGTELFVARSAPYVANPWSQVVKLNWPSKTVAWNLDVLRAGARGVRGVAYVDGALYVSDGYDDTSNPPDEHAVYIFGQRKSLPAINAKINADTASGPAPLTVHFTDESSGSPTSWSWDFGDGGTSTVQNPTHVFDTPGTYTVKLVAGSLTNRGTATMTIQAKDLTAPTASYSVLTGTVWARYTQVTLSEIGKRDDFTPDADITRIVDWGDGTTSTELTHVYRSAGTFTPQVTLTDNAQNSRAVSAGTVVVRADTAAPSVALKRPRNAASVTAWRTLRGTAADAATKVHDVKLRVVEKRGTRWYAYRGTTRSWIPARSRVAALRLSRPAVLAPTTTAWSYRLPGLRKGYLLTTVTARDIVGNTSAAKTYAQLITRR